MTVRDRYSGQRRAPRALGEGREVRVGAQVRIMERSETRVPSSAKRDVGPLTPTLSHGGGAATLRRIVHADIETSLGRIALSGRRSSSPHSQGFALVCDKPALQAGGERVFGPCRGETGGYDVAERMMSQGTVARRCAVSCNRDVKRSTCRRRPCQRCGQRDPPSGSRQRRSRSVRRAARKSAEISNDFRRKAGPARRGASEELRRHPGDEVAEDQIDRKDEEAPEKTTSADAPATPNSPRLTRN